MSLPEKVVTTFQTANAPSTPAAVPIALGDGGRFVTVERREQDRSQPTLVAAARSADRG